MIKEHGSFARPTRRGSWHTKYSCLATLGHLYFKTHQKTFDNIFLYFLKELKCFHVLKI